MQTSAATVFTKPESIEFGRLYSRKKYRFIWVFFAYFVSMPAPVIIYFVFRNIPVLRTGAQIMLCVIATATVLLVAGLAYVAWRRARLQQRITNMLREGIIVPVRVLSVTANFGYTLNRIPQQTIRVEVDGKGLQIKTFDLNVSKWFEDKGAVEVVTQKSTPGFMLPVGYIREKLAAKTAPERITTVHL